ncbi:MAG: DMT family transporter [FCB group bacterium]|nr:DMT family transporter [FCB group bacterium]
MQQNTSRLVLYLLLVSAMLTWGLSWSNGKILAGYTSVPNLIFWRFTLTGLFFTPVVFGTRSRGSINRKGFIAALFGGLLIATYNIFFFLGTRRGLAGAGGVLVTTLNPILTFFLAAFVWRRAIRKKDILGLILGVTGGLIIMRIWHMDGSELFRSGNVFFLLCALSWAILTIIAESSRGHIGTLYFSLITYWVAAILALPFAIHSGILEVFSLNWIFWLNLFSVSAGAMAFGTTIYFLATKKLGSEKASAFIFAVPVSALFFARIFLDEKLSPPTLLGGLLAIVAVYLINRRSTPT